MLKNGYMMQKIERIASRHFADPRSDLPNAAHPPRILYIGVTGQVKFIDHLDFEQH